MRNSMNEHMQSVADPGFHGGRRQPLRGANLLFDQFFSENFMKMKKFWTGGASLAPPRSANGND